MNKSHLTREQWLTEITDLILSEVLAPHATIRSDLKLKLCVGFPPNSRSDSKTIGACLSSSCSSEGYNEIYIVPTIDESIQVLETLVHELIHALDDCKNGHTGFFAITARAVGLEGSLRATTASNELRGQLQEYVNLYGEIPHAHLELANRKRQTNRNLRVLCECGFKFNTSKTQIDYVLAIAGEILCPACAGSMSTD
jgi:hypothetical protein